MRQKRDLTLRLSNSQQALQVCVETLQTDLEALSGKTDEDKALSREVLGTLRETWRVVKSRSFLCLLYLTTGVYLLRAFGVNTEQSGPWIVAGLQWLLRNITLPH